jgi:NADPH:quinone reductase
VQLQRVTRSTVIDAPIERVWAVLRDFNSHDQWHDVVEQSHIEGRRRSDQVGCVRSFTLEDGNHIREQLLTLDDKAYKSTYCIVESTVPLQRYVATVTLKPVTDGNRTFWHWESSFATPPGQEKALRDLVAQGVYEAGFANLRHHLRQGGDLRTPGSAPMPTALPLPTRQVVVPRYGDTDVLLLQDAQVPPPAQGQLRIQQRAIGVNYIDIYLRRGWIPPMLAEGGTPGMEAAGSVIDVGAGAGSFLPGDRVAYLGPTPGAYCGVRNVPAAWVVPLPAAIDDDTAAAFLLKGLTADYLLHDLGRVGPGTTLLVHAAAGGVGLLLCAWARRLGATVIGTVGSEDKARLARAHGCEHVVVTHDYRFADAVLDITHGQGAAVVVDGLGEAASDENLKALARCGHWISLGQASGAIKTIDPNALLHKSLSFSRPVVFDYVATPQALRQRAQRVFGLLADATLPRPPIERHPLAAVAQAHARLQSRRTVGALVLLA